MTSRAASSPWHRALVETPALALALALVAGPACGPGPTARVEESVGCGPRRAIVSRVIDGDTVDLADGRRVRYLLVDTPEVSHRPGGRDECFGPEARAANTRLVDALEVRLEYEAQCSDVYGRTLAYVYVGERLINQVLVERGYARVVIIPPNRRYANTLRAAEAEARSRGLGLWSACDRSGRRASVDSSRSIPK